MKYIEVTESVNCPDNTTPPGAYMWGGCLYVAPGGGLFPTCVALGGLRIKELPDASDSGVSESTLLKAMAIAQNPELAKDLT